MTINTVKVEIELDVYDIADVIAEQICKTTDQYDKMIAEIHDEFSPQVVAAVVVEYDTKDLEILSISSG